MNPNTVMRAYQELERDGLTEKRRGQGTYVTSSSAHVQQFRADLAAKYIVQFLAQMQALGLTNDEVIACIRQKISSEPQGGKLTTHQTKQGGHAQ
jgi:GntR family transcriptional regulator